MKPILFNAEMVREILDGRKTTTRRVIKPQPNYELRRMNDKCHGGGWHEYSENPLCDTVYKSPWGAGYPGPIGNVGDILYVRETFCKYDADDIIDGVKYAYKADATADSEEVRKNLGYKWHPSIHMPKEAARIFLRVTDVRTELLQDITEDGAEAEGVPEDWPMNPVYCPTCKGEGTIGSYNAHTLGAVDIDCPDCKKATERFENLWNSTIKKSDRDKYGWDANPWVWVVEFKRCETIEEEKL